MFIKFSFAVLKLIVATSFALVLWNILTDKVLSNIEEPIAIYDVVIDNYAGKSELLQKVSEKLVDKLDSQIVIASPQRISPTAVLQLYFKLPREVSEYSNYVKLNLDLINYIYRKINSKTPYGGFIMFDYNVGSYTLEQYKTYLSSLKKIYRIQIRAEILERENEVVEIDLYPWLFADCAINLTEVPYCRNFAVRDAVLSEPLDELYKNLGLNSPLSPTIDTIDESFCRDENSLLQTTVKKMHEAKQLPVLKHFLYDARVDTHAGTYTDRRSISEIFDDTYCYRAVDNLGIPFAIMPSHFYLESIDENNILTRSSKFQQYIHMNYKNVVTISDEISMLGYSSHESFDERIVNNELDMILTHGGTFKFWKRWQIQKGIEKLDRAVVKERLARILNLKLEYGLIEIKQGETKLVD